MFYAKINNGAVERYPYTLTDLRHETQGVSFPQTLTDAELADFNVYPVTPTAEPSVDYTKNVSRWAENQGGVWVEVWTVADASADEIATRLSNQWDAVRAERNRKLAGSDWTQLPDCPLENTKQTEWATYRQELRDITSQSNPFAIVWPVQPE